MSVGSILRKAIKDGYYVVSYNDLKYASTESEALMVMEALDKIGLDAVAYRYRDGTFHRCEVIDLLNFSLNNKYSN